jgi:hypothetical protein
LTKITLVSRRVDVRQAADGNIIAESLSQHDKKHVVPTSLSGIRVEKRHNFDKEQSADAEAKIYYFEQELIYLLVHAAFALALPICTDLIGYIHTHIPLILFP